MQDPNATVGDEKQASTSSGSPEKKRASVLGQRLSVAGQRLSVAGQRLSVARGSIVSRLSNASKKFSISSISSRGDPSKPKSFWVALKRDELTPGDLYEALLDLIMRSGESLDTPEVTILPAGAVVKLEALSTTPSSLRIEVTCVLDGARGWISYVSKEKEATIRHHGRHDFEIGGEHEVKVHVGVVDMEGNHVATVQPGDLVVIRSLSDDGILALIARVKSQADDMPSADLGWITLTTGDGKHTLGQAGTKVQQNKAAARFLKYAEAGDADGCKRLLVKTKTRTSLLMNFGKSVDVNETDRRGRTALMLAAMKGRAHVVDVLVNDSTNLNPHARDDYHRVALHHVQRGISLNPDIDQRLHIVQVLHNLNAHLDAQDHLGCTPLMFAAANGVPIMVQQLLDYHANPRQTDLEGVNALAYASWVGKQEVVDLLVSSMGMADTTDANNPVYDANDTQVQHDAAGGTGGEATQEEEEAEEEEGWDAEVADAEGVDITIEEEPTEEETATGEEAANSPSTSSPKAAAKAAGKAKAKAKTKPKAKGKGKAKPKAKGKAKAQGMAAAMAEANEEEVEVGAMATE